MSSTTRNARAIQALLQVQMGTYSNGQLQVHSTGATGTVPKNSFAIPEADGELHEEALVFVQPNPAEDDGSWPVTDSGTLVSVQSVQGGQRVNLPAGTKCRWDPPLGGIEETSALHTGGLTGGVLRTERGTLRQLRLYKSLGSRAEAQDFFAAQADDYPAAVLGWASSTPAALTAGPVTARMGSRGRLFEHEWHLFVITARLESAEVRIREGDQLRDELLELLTDREAYRGLVLDARGGIEIIEARLFAVRPSSYVDIIRFTTQYVLTKRDERTFNDWETTRVVIRTEPQPPYPEIDVVDETIDMT